MKENISPFMLDLLCFIDTFMENIITMIIKAVFTKPNKHNHLFYCLNNYTKKLNEKTQETKNHHLRMKGHVTKGKLDNTILFSVISKRK